MWLAGFRRFLKSTNTWLSLPDLALARWCIGITVTAGLAATWFLLHRLFKFWPATLAGFFVVVDPFLLAQTRRVHTDALATIFLLLTVLLFLLFCVTAIEKHPRRQRYLIFAGIAFGFACLSKSYSLILVPWMPICFWLFRPIGTRWREFLYNTFVTGVFWLSYSLLTVFVFWPIFWHSTALLLGACLLSITLLLQRAVQMNKYINRHLSIATLVLIACTGYAVTTCWLVLDKVGWAMTSPHEINHFFLGEIVADPGWLFYLFSLSIKSTPFVLPFAIIAIICLWKDRKQPHASKDFKITMAMGIAVIFFMVCLSLSSKKFSRYLLPVFPMLDVLAGVGLFYTVKWVGNKFRTTHIRQIGQAAYIVLVFSLTTVPVFVLHPYYGTYYNLCWKVTDIAKIFTVGEVSGLDLAAKYLNKKPGATQMTVQTSDLGHELFSYYFLGTTYHADRAKGIDIFGTPSKSRPVDYEVVYIRDSQIGNVPQSGTLNGTLECVITLNGVDYVWIYRV